jgi:glycosyltransferase involved in cell wall biosynthesis
VWREARGCDVVHIHSALSPAVTIVRAALLALAGHARGSAVVLHAHGGSIQSWLTTRRRRVLLRLAMVPVRRVVAVWTAGQDVLRSVLPEDRVVLIDNGIRVENFTAAEGSNDPPRVLFVGLLTPRKGVLDLLAASRLLRERGVPHRLCLLGGTPDEGPEAEAAVRAGVDEGVELLGTRAPKEMPGEFAAADVFCQPSRWEAMPLSVLEAMAAGLPVVATDVGDVHREVVDGTTGYVVPVKDPGALADALERLLADPGLRRRMGAAGRARVVEKFSSEVMAGQISDLYDQLRRGA